MPALAPRAAAFAALALLLSCCGLCAAESVITLAPSAQTGLFVDVGPLNPHGYRPNEFFANDWVYEGLVQFSSGGEIVPALAESWTERQTGAGVTITFALRQGVTFHDGTAWNASVAVANFDNVLAAPLRGADYHGWFDLVNRIKAWRAVDDFTFELELDSPYYPAIQELAYIRPLRMLSLAQMPGGNTCPPQWGTVSLPSNASASVTCMGILSPVGTGPYFFDKKVTTTRTIGPQDMASTAINVDGGERVTEVHFVANQGYWGGRPAVDRLVARAYATHAEVAAALLDGSIDMAYGSGTLTGADYKTVTGEGSGLVGLISPPVATRLVAINSGRGPTSSLAVRKAVIHAVNKADIVRKEMEGLESVAHTVFAAASPYTNFDLFPLLDFDAEKAELLLELDGWKVSPGGATREKDGAPLTLEFIFVEDDAANAAVEDDIRAHLATQGITVVAVPLSKEEYNARAASGDFHLAFSSTWGVPYDPHSSAAAWRVPNGEPDHAAQKGMRNDNPSFASPMNKTQLDALISQVITTLDSTKRADMWRSLLTAIHEQAIYLPMTYKTNLAVMRPGIEGFRFGVSEFDIPVRQLNLAGTGNAAAAGAAAGTGTGSSGGLSSGAIAGIVVACVVAAVACLSLAFLVLREKSGSPVFAPLLPPGDKYSSPDDKYSTQA